MRGIKAEGYVVDPPIGRDAHNLLYRANKFFGAHRAAYPLALDSDQRGAVVAVAGGYAERLPDDPHFVRVTQKGRLYLATVMRAH